MAMRLFDILHVPDGGKELWKKTSVWESDAEKAVAKLKQYRAVKTVMAVELVPMSTDVIL